MSTTPLTLSERKELVALIRSIVVAQGNIFIRELLRRNGLRIGTNKEEFERNLLNAIDNGELRLSLLREWLEEVEGWGDQHVYLYHVPREVLDDLKWASPETLRASLPAQQQKLWQSDKVLHFPAKPTLTGIFYENDALRYVWHQAYDTWQRSPEKDYQQELEGDLYEFRAYRQRKDRTVRRFVLRRDLGVAAIFLQTEWSAAEHGAAIDEVKKAVGPVAPFEKLEAFRMPVIIRNLDQIEIEAVATDLKLKAQKARFSDAGAYVEFASTTELGYKDSEEVRRVRKAVRRDSKLSGANGTFIYPTATPTGAARPVKFDIFGEQGRIKLRSQLSAADVWRLLAHIQRAESWGRLTKEQTS